MSVPGTLLTEWARLLLASLRQSGITDVVISPGSRSTPIAHAALADRGIRCRSVIDERDAAFFAVGHARMTGRPAAVLCTSGSAAANYFPAVVEASRACVPLLVVTADRPYELQDADAPQTIDQRRLFGSFSRGYFDPGMADAHPAALRALQRTAAQAVHRALWPQPGPVQINVRARKPLEPRAGGDAAAHELAGYVTALIEAGPTRPVSPGGGGHDPEGLRALAAECAGARRGLIVCGPISPAEPAAGPVLELARRTGFALLPEAASQLRFEPASPGVTVVDVFDTLLRSEDFRDVLDPDLVLEVGAPPTSSAWRDYVAGAGAPPRHVFSSRGWSDPHGSARTLVHGPLAAGVRSLIDALDEEAGRDRDDAWLEWLARAAAAARAATETAGLDGPGFTEGAAVRAVVAALPDGATLALGNSLPIREVDTFCPASSRRIRVWSQRGANGIDGLIAGAAGAAAATGQPTVLLLGDVSFLHDIGGLAVARDSPAPLALVVLDNGGGRIFDQLPLRSADSMSPESLRFWTTPPDLDLEHAARAFGIEFLAASGPDALEAAVAEALAITGPTVLRAAVDGDRTMPLHRAVWEAARERVAREAGRPPGRPT